MNSALAGKISGWLARRGMILVLLMLAVFLGFATLADQNPNDADAGTTLAKTLDGSKNILIVVRPSEEDAIFAQAIETQMIMQKGRVVEIIKGTPSEARTCLERLQKEGVKLDAIVCNHFTATWSIFENMDTKFPGLGDVKIVEPASYRWPNFFKRDNLVNIVNQIAVIAILAVGMTFVILTGGIDLSVGAMIAFSAVLVARLIRDYGGGVDAHAPALIACSIAAVGVCALMGMFSGAMVACFSIPPFITTLAMMLIAGGMAYLISDGQSIDRVPESFMWLGRGSTLMRIPVAVVLTAILYLIAHLAMTRTVFGRYVYAVGGNREAARLSGVSVLGVLILVYTLSGALAGLGGVVMASQLKSGAPTYGHMYELYVIAAVVVGGTSLAGGEGKITGTLIGALILAVIQNGMNLLGFDSNTQKCILGGVLLLAILLDGSRYKLTR
ncbi:MAG: ABC transporter permease [Planctomycetota bacterium]|nr:ABC transporter permease [Planctomycetota bacterium]